MKQYIRKCRLVVSGGGNGLDLSHLRIGFSVKKEDAETPNSAQIRIYNLAESTAKRIKDEFTHVTLEAGYEANCGVIFDGNIIRVAYGREDMTETFVDIEAGDGDEAYNFATVNQTLAAGSTQAQQIDAAFGSMRGVQRGFTCDMSEQALPRGKVMFGMSRDYLRGVAQTTESTWSVQDGKLQFVKLTGTAPGKAVLLNSRTGMIGAPVVDNGGVQVKCLLNPTLKIGGRVKIDEASVGTGTYAIADGVYRVLTIEHSGDTYGEQWMTSIEALDVNASAPDGEQVAL